MMIEWTIPYALEIDVQRFIDAFEQRRPIDFTVDGAELTFWVEVVKVVHQSDSVFVRLVMMGLSKERE